jgi:hypothetical protein
MEKYSGYESWLKASQYVSWKTYLSFMRQIEKDLGGIGIEKINSVAYLKKLMAELQTKSAFLSRGDSDKGNILSGFRTYIDYVEQKNKSI